MTLEDYAPQLKDKMDRYRTQSLFWEMNVTSMPPLFSLKDYDHTVKGVTYPSLKKIFLEVADPTEYEFAIAIFGSWPHWQRICSNRMIGDVIAAWREELQIKLVSEAVKNVAKQAAKGSVQASTWLAKRSWETSRGRPSKIEVDKEKRIAAGVNMEIDEDMERLDLERH